jgi:hypothetical protein
MKPYSVSATKPMGVVEMMTPAIGMKLRQQPTAVGLRPQRTTKRIAVRDRQPGTGRVQSSFIRNTSARTMYQPAEVTRHVPAEGCLARQAVCLHAPGTQPGRFALAVAPAHKHEEGEQADPRDGKEPHAGCCKRCVDHRDARLCLERLAKQLAKHCTEQRPAPR